MRNKKNEKRNSEKRKKRDNNEGKNQSGLQ